MISIAVEGLTDEVVLRRLCDSNGIGVSACYGKNGRAQLDRALPGFNRAAAHHPWLVLRDLDDAACAPELRAELLPNRALHMCFRVAVREVESWLLADRTAIANFLAVSEHRIPLDPEGLHRPKRALIDAARHSRRRHVWESVVPEQGSGRAVGPGYTSFVAEFVDSHWSPTRARIVSNSLDRAMRRLHSFARHGRW
jgi:hypothetical protein